MDTPPTNQFDAVAVYLESEESMVHQISKALQEFGITLFLEPQTSSDPPGSEFIMMLERMETWLIFIGKRANEPWNKIQPSFEKIGNSSRPQPIGILLPDADFDLIPPVLKSHFLVDLTKGPDDRKRIEELAEAIRARRETSPASTAQAPTENTPAPAPPPPAPGQKTSRTKAAAKAEAKPEPTRQAEPREAAEIPETEPQPIADQKPPPGAQAEPKRKGFLRAMTTGFTGGFTRSFMREIRKIREGRTSRRKRMSSGEMTLISAKAAAVLTGLAAISGGIHSARQDERVKEAVEADPGTGTSPEASQPGTPEDRRAIAARVTRLIVAQLGVTAEQITPAAKLIQDLGADSLDVVELIMAVEEQFGVMIPDAEAEKLTTVGSIIDYLSKARAAKA